ncbi:MAG: hypothetical protein WC971_02620 [Coriobacteriia bacterium]
MDKSKLARIAYGTTFLTVLFTPAVALAAEEPAKAAVVGMAVLGKALGAGLAMGLSGIGAGYAQANIGSAGAGTLAERPEVATYIIVLQALPEIIALLGMVVAFLILQA